MYKPTEKDNKTAENWLKASDPEIEKGIDTMGYYPLDYCEALETMNKYAAWNIREFCKDLRPMIENWEKSDEHIHGGVSIAELFSFHIISKFK